jgi:hypothetical protein
MSGFEELQALWQAQSPLAARVAEVDALRRSLREYGRRMNRIYIVKAAAIAVITGTVLAFGHLSQPVLGALAAVIAVAFTVLALDWRHQRSIASVDFTTVSAAFVRGTIRRLREQSAPFQRSYWFIFSAVALSENVCVVSLAHEWTWPVRGACHVLATALPLGALELGRRVRIRRFERECRPILDRLTAMEQSLQEEAE